MDNSLTGIGKWSSLTEAEYKEWFNRVYTETLLEFRSSNQHINVDHTFIKEDREPLNKIAERLGADRLELISEYYLDKVPYRNSRSRKTYLRTL